MFSPILFLIPTSFFPKEICILHKKQLPCEITKLMTMKKHILTLIFLLTTAALISIQAEPSVIDSLKQEIQRAERQKASRDKLLELYQNLCVEYETIDADSSFRYIRKGLSLYEQPNFQEEVYLHLLNALANHYLMEGEVERAKEGFKTVAAHAPQLKERNYDLEGVLESSIGVCYRKLGMYDSAVYHYNRAIDICKKTGKPEDVSSIYYNIGVLYHLNKRYEEALTQGKLSAEYAQKAHDLLMELYANCLIGGVYSKLGKYAEACQILRQNIEKALDADTPLLAMSSLCPLLGTYQLWNKKDSAQIFLKKGEELIHQIPPNSPTALEFYATQASLYHWIGKYQRSLDILTGNPLIQTQVPYDKFYKLMAHNYEGLGNYQKAYQYIEKVCTYQDSVFNGKIKDELSELNEKLRTSDKELKIARLEKDQAQQKQIRLRHAVFYVTVIVALLIVVSVLLYKRRLQKKETELIAARQYIEGLENERKRLAKDLHDGVCNDLLGAILQVQQQVSTNELKATTVHTLEEIRSGIRAISHELMPPNFQFTDLNEMLTDYFSKIQEVSGVTIHYTPHLQTEWSHIPERIGYEIYRIMQETIGNILKHAHASLIHIHLDEVAGELAIKLQYNGHWEISAEGSKGIGLRTIEDRLKTIGGQYTIQKDNTGICIHIHVRLH